MPRNEQHSPWSTEKKPDPSKSRPSSPEGMISVRTTSADAEKQRIYAPSSSANWDSSLGRTFMPFSPARVLQLSATSAKLFFSLALRLFSGDVGGIARRWAAIDAGVARDETFDDENERRLYGVYGVESEVTGVYGEELAWRWWVRCSVR